MTPPWSPWEQDLLVAGRYRLLRQLGSGSSAHVWAARDESLGREVALKALSGSTAQGGHEHERLKREACLLAALNHPRITTVYDFVEIAGQDGTTHPFLVTEIVDGESLSARLERGPLPPAEALTVCAQVADALATAHGSGVVHRDVKPGNVMLTAHGAMLLDFGISRRDTDTDLTGKVLIGTPACMAPEQWNGQPAQPASDVYALGCLLYWCLSGHAPYHEREIPALGMSHLLADPPPLPLGGRHGAAVETLYLACVRKNPAERPNARDVAAVLEVRAQSRLLTAHSNPSTGTPPTAEMGKVEAAETTGTTDAADAADTAEAAEPARTAAEAKTGTRRWLGGRFRQRRRTWFAAYAASASAVLAASIALPLMQSAGSPGGAAASQHTSTSNSRSTAQAATTSTDGSSAVDADQASLSPATVPTSSASGPHDKGGKHTPGHGKSGGS